MNSLNYGSREACERLFKAGIVLETDFYWCDNLGWVTLRPKEDIPIESCDWKIYPAPSMAEVWRELPIISKGPSPSLFIPYLVKVADDSEGVVYSAFYAVGEERPVPVVYQNSNPTDALIDLRIWLEERKEESHDPI